MLGAKKRRSYKQNVNGSQSFSTLNTTVKHKYTKHCPVIPKAVEAIAIQLGIPPGDASGCPKTPTNTVYTDPYALNKQPKNACISYKQFQPQIQNKNGYINSGYNYSTKQLLSRRNLTYEVKQFNFLSKCKEKQHSYNIIDTSCTDVKYNCDSFKRWENAKQNYTLAIYKPNNTQYSQQGAVSGGSRINRLKYQTTLKSQARYVKNVKNMVNGEYPASLYQNGGPVQKSITSKEHTNNCKRTQRGLAQHCFTQHCLNG